MLTTEQERVIAEADPPVDRVVFSPYRACLVGAHVDHQGGKVTGFGLDRGIVLGYSPNPGGAIRLTDATLAEHVSVDSRGDVEDMRCTQDWSRFLVGAASRMPDRRNGFQGVVAGSLPPGGLSSSAAFSLAILTALADVNDVTLSASEFAGAAVEIEHRFVGVKCGLLDPTIIVNARADHLVTLDCATNTVTVEPGPKVAIVAVYSGIARSLVATGFNSRTEECREAARLLARMAGREAEDEAPRLGDLPRDLLRDRLEELPDPYRGRARHYLTEVERVERAILAWRAGDLAAFGECARESLESSIRNYETGNPEQQVLARILNSAPGVYGARFCGGGFGGFVAGICDPEAAGEAGERAVAEYVREFPRFEGEAFAVASAPADGLRRLR